MNKIEHLSDSLIMLLLNGEAKRQFFIIISMNSRK
jgi:hypothetical protein